MPLDPGTRLGPYEVTGRLGAGAMGEVYRARDTRLGRDVALKILPAEFASSPDRRRRFEQESRAASALNHPNIVLVYDAGEDQGVSYIASELVDGESLRDLIGRGALPLRKAVDLAAQLADGLAAAHAAGVVHRDMKPENVMLTRESRAKILDFGLARYQPAAAPAEGTATMTQAGMIMGTVGYMSPEQVTGNPADARSDIFSLGIILYEMLTGKVAFACPTSVETMSAILRSDPPDLPATVPDALRRIVQHCLEKEPARRFQSAKDLAFALQSYAGAYTSTIAPAPQLAAARRPRALPAVTAALAVLLAYTLAVLLLKTPGADLTEYRYTPFATETEIQGGASWSPDGKNVAYERVNPNAPNVVVVRSLDSVVPNPVASLNHTNGIFWSADSSQVYFVAAENGVWSVSRAGGAKQQVLKGNYEAAALSPDSKALVLWFARDDSDQKKAKILVSSPPGAPPREYQPVVFKMNGTFSPVRMRFSPDGRQVLLSIFRPGGAELWLLPFPDGPSAARKPHRIFTSALAGAMSASASWMPDSRHVVLSFSTSASSPQLRMADTESETLQPLTADAGNKLDPAVAPDGKRLLYTSGSADFDMVEVPVDGSSTIHTLLATNRTELFPSWAPNTSQFAYVTDRSGPVEIWLKSAREGWERPLVTGHDFPDDETKSFLTPAFSPDGTRIAYSRYSAKHFGALWISPVAGGPPIRLTNSDAYDVGASWSPDGNWITYFSSSGGLMKIKVGANEAPVVVDSDSCLNPPVWSPDGQWIACAKNEGVALFTPAGKKERTVGSRRAFITWSRDSKLLYALGHVADGPWKLGAIDVQTGAEKILADFGTQYTFATNSDPSFLLSLSPDGKSLATSVWHARSEIWMLEGFPQPTGWLRKLLP